MFQPFYEHPLAICFIFGVVWLLCILGFFLIGILAKKGEVLLNYLLLGQEYVFAAISSVVIFLIFALPLALVLWLFFCLGMNFIFRGNRELAGAIAHYDKMYESSGKKELRDFPDLDCFVRPSHVSSWFKEFRQLRRASLEKLKRDIPCQDRRYRRRIFPFSLVATGVIGIAAAWIAYGTLILNSTIPWMILLEGHAFFSVFLFLFYWAFYAFMSLETLPRYGMVIAPPKILFNVCFAIIATLVYIIITSAIRNI